MALSILESEHWQTSTCDDIDSASNAAMALKELTYTQARLCDVYHQFSCQATHTVDNKTAKRLALTQLLKVEHQLKGMVAYLAAPLLMTHCQYFHDRLKRYTVETETKTNLNEIDQAYQQLLTYLKQAIEEFHTLLQDSLKNFVATWKQQYQLAMQSIALFDAPHTQHWSKPQQQKFCYEFYHIRGHFYKLLWLLGNTAPNSKQEKALILDNYQEEFGGSHDSHESLYRFFAQFLGIEDLGQEFITGNRQPLYVHAYNQGHLEWFSEQNWLGKMAGFAAYELLDNIDYACLLTLSKSFGLDESALTFFVIHNKADHFDKLYSCLLTIWKEEPAIVKTAFDFIGPHQLDVWRALSQSLSA
ncbi:MAG: iron-containing redox enzyme family protein [Gammaproteobacteria bacterium]|nr:iron-containing redox enzyme family protein [Gammaproteobacteria bacterium]